METAKQLQTQGNKIAFLGLIHAIPYHSKQSLFKKIKLVYVKLKSFRKFHFNKHIKQKSQQQIEYDYFVDSFNNSLRNYLSTPYIGDMTLFYQSEKSSKLSVEIELARSVALGNIEVCEIPAKYDDNLFVSPRVEILSEKLKQCLEKVRIS